jgi:phosphoribosylformylglycinamidine cyclo-ligase
MLRVFNCGVGMVVAVSDPEAACLLLEAEGESVSRIGVIEAGVGPASVQIDPPAGWLA